VTPEFECIVFLALASCSHPVLSTLPQDGQAIEASPGGSPVVTQFGYALAVLGDVNGDGASDLAIGAPYDSVKGSNAGCVFVISGREGKLILRLQGRSAQERLGTVVRSGADLDGDGIQDVIADPEPRYEIGSTSGVTLRCFSSRDGRVLPGIPKNTSFLGTDLDGDGVIDTLASRLDVEAYVVSGKNHQILRVFPEQRPGGYMEGFGASVAWLGDVDRDGVPDVAVGCAETIDSGDQYYVTVFSGRDARVIRVLDADNTMTVVGEGGDFNGDGIPDLPVGLPEQDTVVVLDGRVLGAGARWSDVRRADWQVLLTLRRAQYPSN
jgi:hypothetical protein